MIDSSIYRTGGRIRSLTLHPRIGAHQNGSTSVRFEGRVHAHHLPEDRESQADGIFEADYVNKLEEKSTIVSDLKRAGRLRCRRHERDFELLEFWQVG